MALFRRFDPEKHHRRSIRLKGYDYTSPGAYFITICSSDKDKFFGFIENGIMKLNDFGHIVNLTWFDLPNHNPHISLDAFVVMPDHIHGIVIINGCNNVGAGSGDIVGAGSGDDIVGAGSGDDIVGAGSEPAPTTTTTTQSSAPTIHGLPEIIRQFKTFSARRINEILHSPGKPVWQRNYYEHIIRENGEMERIRKYIRENPAMAGNK